MYLASVFLDELETVIRRISSSRMLNPLLLTILIASLNLLQGPVNHQYRLAGEEVLVDRLYQIIQV